MGARFLIFVGTSILLVIGSLAQEGARPTSTGPTSNEVLVFVPSTANQSGSERNFDLFKLDGSALLSDVNEDSTYSPTEDGLSENPESRQGSEAENVGKGRESRKLTFFRGMWNKPKAGPLYLVNGTVCRFVNTMPICTTLVTTGLIPFGGTTNRPNQINGSSLLPNNQLNQANQFNQNQQFRPAALREDESHEMEVKIPTNISAQALTKPLNLVLNRRALNLLSFRKPSNRNDVAIKQRERVNELSRQVRTRGGRLATFS